MKIDEYDDLRTERPAGAARRRDEAAESDDRPRAASPDLQFSSLYDELLAIARRMLGNSATRHSFQATALVHEAYLKLRESGRACFADRKGFLALVARVMRCVLVDHVRRRSRAKRGAGVADSRLEEIAEVATDPVLEAPDLVALDDALRCLGRVDPAMEKIVEMRFFLGLDVARTARVLGIPKRTVERKWAFAREVLQRLLP